MDLKKQMEKDLEVFEEELIHSCSSLYSKKLVGQIDLIKKYLKYFENTIKIIVGENYKLKEGKALAFNGSVDIECELVLEDQQLVYVKDLEIYDDEKNIGVVHFASFEYSDWMLDIETFKFMFEECENG